jgi:predicted nucleic acid-binding protein
MRGLFVDTSFFVAFLNPSDRDHGIAADYMDDFPGRLITTSLVLIELGNFVCAMRHRRLLAPLVTRIRRDKRFLLLAAKRQLFNAALAEYDARPDQHWSFTDCASFTVMRRFKLTQALTTDHHFEQAGFIALLRR